MEVRTNGAVHPTAARDELYELYRDRVSTDENLSRRLVSYQGNKTIPGLRWLKYKEGFSGELVQDLLSRVEAETVLDPFSGSGITPLTACSLGMNGIGIEIMPVGNLFARSIITASNGLPDDDFRRAASDLVDTLAREDFEHFVPFNHLPITEMAFPENTERELAKARGFIEQLLDQDVRLVLTLACVSVLEEISYTRKDGQFLRWDPQSGRPVSPKLHKTNIPALSEALHSRIEEILEDIPILRDKYTGPYPDFLQGSSLTELRNLESASIDAVVTSPPYANRYDYTRTYALELAYLGYGEESLKELRQSLLSATVENRSKRELLTAEYGRSDVPSVAFQMTDNQAALQEALAILRAEAENLSNRNVITLVENYFTELALVVVELSRVVKPGGNVFMINDNVRYHGQEIPVDLILSHFAEQSGFRCENIWTLGRGKGNSSQQMGRFGRQELRKCIYRWRKTDA